MQLSYSKCKEMKGPLKKPKCMHVYMLASAGMRVHGRPDFCVCMHQYTLPVSYVCACEHLRVCAPYLDSSGPGSWVVPGALGRLVLGPYCWAVPGACVAVAAVLDSGSYPGLGQSRDLVLKINELWIKMLISCIPFSFTKEKKIIRKK